jgi:hypothetical protein
VKPLALDDVVMVSGGGGCLPPDSLVMVKSWFIRRPYKYDGVPQATGWEEVAMKPTVTICDEAKGLVYGPREEAYAHPADDFGRTAAMWSAILGHYVSPETVGLCMIAVKLSRECHKHKRDNLVDIAGYAETVQRVHEFLKAEE